MNNPTKENLSKEAIEFCDKVYPCTPPCDSYGVCEGCSEKNNFLAGYEMGAQSKHEELKKLREAVRAASGCIEILKDSCGIDQSVARDCARSWEMDYGDLMEEK